MLALLWTCGVAGQASARGHGGTPPKRPGLKLEARLGHELKRFQLTADHLKYLPGKGTVLLTGQVKLTAGKLRLTAHQVRVLFDPRGRPLRFEARKAVTLKLGRSRGQAGAVDLGLKSRVLVLTGTPRLRWAPLGLTLTGQRIQVALDTGGLEVQLARARIEPEHPGTLKKQGDTKGSGSGAGKAPPGGGI
jgi:lipopolysaccharide export system protein LptA